MVLHNASLYGREGLHHILVEEGMIRAIVQSMGDLPRHSHLHVYELEGALVLPGLINSHDHLDFNLFPRLGNRLYEDYTQWGPQIQKDHAELVRRIRNIPANLRVAWGQYKNLLNGFTTVVNHGERIHIDNSIVDVYQEAQSLHSAAFEKNWKWKLNNPLRLRQKVAIHAGEGTSDVAVDELGTLVKHNFLGRDIIAIHGVALDDDEARQFRGLVWCPSSNYFLLGKTAAIDKIKDQTEVVFGTDSTLTASWNAWEHFRQAGQLVEEEELLDMLTVNPARLWKLRGRGRVANNFKADLLIVRKDKPLFENNPSDLLAVFRKGKLLLLDDVLSKGSNVINSMSAVMVGNKKKHVVGNINELAERISTYYPFQNPLAHA